MSTAIESGIDPKLSSLTTPLKEDEFQKNLLIPKEIKNTTISSNTFEIYLSGKSTKCGLMIGKGDIENKIEDFYNESSWPYFIKFTRETVPIPLQNNEYVKFISCGLQHLVIATNLSKCYLFGDYLYGNNIYSGNKIKEQDYHYCFLLQFNKINTLRITHLDCGEQYVIVKDELNRFWYSGKNGFGEDYSETCFYSFIQLNSGELQLNETITKVVAGGRHAAICVDDKFIYTIGNNYFNQLGTNRSPVKNKTKNEYEMCNYAFVKADWNEDGNYIVQELACSGNATVVLTKCGKIFKSSQSSQQFTLINNCQDKIIAIGTSWSEIVLATTESNKITLLGDYNEEFLETNDSIKSKLFGGREMKLFSGTGDSESFGSFVGNQVKIFKGSESVKIETQVPIKEIKFSGEIALIFCLKEKTDVMQEKLFKTIGLFDIDFIF
ncbi:hypothetical protein ABK040_002605 [Willaertia magna]